MTKAKDRWEFYRDARSKWRWRRVAGNGRVVDASTQGYGSRSACVNNAQRCGYEPTPKPRQIGERLSLMGHFQPRYFTPRESESSKQADDK